MEENNKGRDQMFNVYEKLEDDNKEKIVRLAEGLLNSQNMIYNWNMKSTEKNEDIESIVE